MININTYIIEKLQLTKNTKVVSTDKLNLDLNKIKGKSKIQFEDVDIDRICELIEKLPIKPDEITNSKVGGIVLKYHGGGNFYSKKLKSEIHITLPDRYNKECYKITWYTPVDYMPYEYPLGNNYMDKKKNKPKLETIDEVFDQILKHWKDRNMSNVVNKNA